MSDRMRSYWLFALLLLFSIHRIQQRRHRWLAVATHIQRLNPMLVAIAATDKSGRFWQRRINKQSNVVDIDLAMNEEQFRSHYRFSKQNFERLCIEIDQFWPQHNPCRAGRPPLPMKQCVLMVLKRLSSTYTTSDIAERYGMGRTSVEKYSRIVFDCILQALLPRFLRWPTTPEEIGRVQRGFSDRATSAGYRRMPGLVGTMDGTHIELHYGVWYASESDALFRRQMAPDGGKIPICCNLSHVRRRCHS